MGSSFCHLAYKVSSVGSSRKLKGELWALGAIEEGCRVCGSCLRRRLGGKHAVPTPTALAVCIVSINRSGPLGSG